MSPTETKRGISKKIQFTSITVIYFNLDVTSRESTNPVVGSVPLHKMYWRNV